jgi:hypothetical protein
MCYLLIIIHEWLVNDIGFKLLTVIGVFPMNKKYKPPGAIKTARNRLATKGADATFQ